MSEQNARPLFSVIIACYNYGHLLPRAIASVLAQTCADYEMIVVDDGSTDGTPQAVQPFLDRIVYHRQENAGHCATNNKGAKLARGEYFYFLDADDELLPNALTDFAAAIAQAPDMPVWFGGYISVADGKERPHVGGDLPADAEQRLRDYIVKKAIGLKHGSVVMQRRIFDEMQYPVNLRNNTDIVFLGQVVARFAARGIGTPVVKSHAHADRVRKNVALKAATGLAVVDILFDPAVMPAALQKLKPLFKRQRLLSLARALYHAHEYRIARDYYLRAVGEFPLCALDPAVLRRLLISAVKAARGGAS